MAWRSNIKTMGMSVYPLLSKVIWPAFKAPALRTAITGIPETTEGTKCFRNSEAGSQDIQSHLVERGFDVRELTVDLASYHDYLRQALPDYKAYGYLGLRNPEKLLEHYVSFQLLQINSTDTYIDIASASSPTPEIARRLYGCTAYHQDMIFPPGIHGDRIGGDAGAMDVPERFASKMALHCSFEHFEGDADIRFTRAASRLLRPGGRLCILPLYLNKRYAIVTDPLWWIMRGKPNFEVGAKIHFVRGYMNRHARFYDVDHLDTRIRQNRGDLTFTIYYVRNQKIVDPACYIKFIALMEKPSS
jgi:hypothetical protein